MEPALLLMILQNISSGALSGSFIPCSSGLCMSSFGGVDRKMPVAVLIRYLDGGKDPPVTHLSYLCDPTNQSSVDDSDCTPLMDRCLGWDSGGSTYGKCKYRLFDVRILLINDQNGPRNFLRINHKAFEIKNIRERMSNKSSLLKACLDSSRIRLQIIM